MGTPENPEGTPRGKPPGTATAAVPEKAPEKLAERPAEKPAEKPPLEVELVWQGDLRFRGASKGVVLDLDSDGKAGVSPMQTLAFALAGCMSMDVVHYLNKARYPPRAVHASLSGRRPADPPSRFTAITLHFTIEGDAPEDQVHRAIQLSREKYCSVWNSMRQDIAFDVTFAVNRALPAD